MTRPTPTAELPGVMDPQALTLGRAYASALLDALPADADAAVLGEELTELANLTRSTAGCGEFLADPAGRSSDRRAMVERIFGPFVSGHVAALLGVLANNHRLDILPAVAEQYGKVLDQRMNRIDVSVCSALPLTDKQAETLTAALAEKLGATPKLTQTVDPQLVGGLRIQVGDKVYDASVAGALQRFRAKMEYKE
ncbi:MAG: ATP synthase F1 subunit delta [Phycisphaerae bacterium]|nr:ATP synthase F1 subunit delta [Phycisphaerae bacterium]